uniref:Centrosomal protein of 19 kDa n=1 Tax=Globisporangium ultimum (strain ATCC 200006 / CBS 805.95 / DAOM BR144) TaxID=431595 RepID=K3WEH9_GLOUD
MVSSAIEPRRLALRYTPPGIIVEYAACSSGIARSFQQLYHHEIDLQSAIQSLKGQRASSEDTSIDEIVNKLIEQHDQVLGDQKVPSRQLTRLVQKLLDQANASSGKSEANHVATAAVTAAAMLPQADYNRVSETQLKQVKQKMDLVFQQNFVRPGEEGYVYDKQVAFQPAQDASDWDDDD